MATRFLRPSLYSCIKGTASSGVRLQQAFNYSVDILESNPCLSPSIETSSEVASTLHSGINSMSQPTQSIASPEDYFLRDNQLPTRGFATKNSAAARGVYKAIILGQVGKEPVQRILKNGRAITIFTIGTGGMRSDKRPFESELLDEPVENRSMQWHRVCVHQERLGAIAYKVLKQGMRVYVEGNIETRVFNDYVSGAIRRVQEIVLRQNGRLMFMPTSSSES